MKNPLKISLIQSSLFWEDVTSNLSHFDNKISKISKSDIILLPEMFNTAFSPKATFLAEKMDGRTINWMKKISQENQCSIAGTLMVEEEGKVYNRLVWINNNGLIHTYDKRHLFSLIKEEKYISRGKKRLIIDFE